MEWRRASKTCLRVHGVGVSESRVEPRSELVPRRLVDGALDGAVGNVGPPTLQGTVRPVAGTVQQPSFRGVSDSVRTRAGI